MEKRLSLVSKLGFIGVVFAVMAVVTFGTSAKSAAAAGPIASVTVGTTGVATCNGQFSATATVRDVQGFPVPGVPVSFSSNGGTLIATSGATNAAGQATATFRANVIFNGNASVFATIGGVTGVGNVFINCAPVVQPIVQPVIFPVNPCTFACAAPVNCQLFRPPCVYPGVTTCGVYGLPCNVPFTGGAPARVNLAVSPGSISCGSSATVSANVTDALGVAVPNGTGVGFSSSIGVITSASTIGGNATATLSVPAGAAGVAVIRATAGGATGTTTVQVNCAPPPVQQVVVVAQQPARPAPAVIVQQPVQQQTVVVQQPSVIVQRPAPVVQRPAPAAVAPRPAPPRAVAPAIPAFGPPRTGEAGLADSANLILGDDSAADQALVSAWNESQYGVLDASQYDWVVTGEDSDASSQLAQDLLDEAYGVIDASQFDAVVVAADSEATTTLVVDITNNPSDYGNA